jgi:hypothetical protein
LGEGELRTDGAQPAPAGPGATTEDLEEAIRHAYRLAEESYYDGLIVGMQDPLITEAVVRRRTRRIGVPLPEPELLPESEPEPAS